MVDYNAKLTLDRIRAALETQRVDDALAILLSLHPVDRAEVSA